MEPETRNKTDGLLQIMMPWPISEIVWRWLLLVAVLGIVSRWRFWQYVVVSALPFVVIFVAFLVLLILLARGGI